VRKLPEFSANPEVAKFIAHMTDKHEFDGKDLANHFSKISPNQRVLTLFRPPQPSQTTRPDSKSWRNYKARFINKPRIEGGIAFWRENLETLNRAYEQYGVPPEVIVAIIGVETLYGKHTGGFGVMEALASLAFHDPGRGDFFRSELEHFLLLSRENGFDFLRPQGSYAGAIGIPQFMPGSWRKYAVDFDGDGVIDLERNIGDAIGSVANYLKEHGWEKDEAVAQKVKVNGSPKAVWLDAGMLPSLKVEELAKNGVQVDPNSPGTATFISLVTPQQPTEYWLGYKNYYAITRYNRSTFYAMSVVQLAEELKAGTEPTK
jgi:membrane-bound lytic murein transglycosylase B